MKIFNVLVPVALTGQFQGRRDDGKYWTATVTDYTFSYQEGGHSIAAIGNEPTKEGRGMATMCSEMLGGCVTSQIEFSDHSWDGKNLVLVGTDDKFGPFNAGGTAKDGNMIMQKTYKNGLKVEMIVDSVPSESGQFLFGNFEFETNAGQRRGFD